MPRRQDEDAKWIASQFRPDIRRAPKAIGEVLSQLMTRRGYAHVQIAYEWVEAWKKAAGELAPRSRPGRFSRGVLEVVVQDSATLQELTFRTKQLLADMNKLAPQFKLRGVRFKVGEVG